jgi:DNA-binding NtrC family response regulator
MPSAPPTPLPEAPELLASEEPPRESSHEAPAPAGEFLRVEYSGPFKACKDGLVRAFEREYLTRLLHHTQGNIARAAREAELDRKHLYSLLYKYGLVRSKEAD